MAKKKPNKNSPIAQPQLAEISAQASSYVAPSLSCAELGTAQPQLVISLLSISRNVILVHNSLCLHY